MISNRKNPIMNYGTAIRIGLAHQRNYVEAKIKTFF